MRSPLRAWLGTKRQLPSLYRFASTVKLDFSLSSGGDKGNAPLVIMHGLFGSKRNWGSLSKQLARNLERDVYCVDLRNHGDSPHVEPHDYETMASDIEQFARDHELGPAILMGHSMGAKTAMVAALRNPQNVKALIAVDNAPVDSVLSSNFGTYLDALNKIDRLKLKKRSAADQVLQESEPNIGIRQFLLTNLMYDEEGSLRVRLPLRILNKSLDNMGDFPASYVGKRYEKPSLFIRGTQSRYIADETLPAVGTYFPRFRLVDIAAGHWVQAEKPTEVREAIEEFLNDLTE